MPTLFTEDFAGANDTTLTGKATTTGGGVWAYNSAAANTFRLDGVSRCKAIAAGSWRAVAHLDAAAADAWVEALVAGHIETGLALCIGDQNNFIGFRFWASGVGFEIIKFVAGAETRVIYSAVPAPGTGGAVVNFRRDPASKKVHAVIAGVEYGPAGAGDTSGHPVTDAVFDGKTKAGLWTTGAGGGAWAYDTLSAGTTAGAAIAVTAADAVQTQGAEVAVITVAAIAATAADAAQTQGAEVASVTVAAIAVAPADAAQAQGAEVAVVTVAAIAVTAADAAQAQGADGAGVTVAAIAVATADGGQTQGAEEAGVTLAGATAVAPADAIQTQAAEVASVTVAAIAVATADGGQTQGAEEAGVTLAGATAVAPADAAQTQGAEVAVVTAAAIAVAPVNGGQTQSATLAALSLRAIMDALIAPLRRIAHGKRNALEAPARTVVQ